MLVFDADGYYSLSLVVIGCCWLLLLFGVVVGWLLMLFVVVAV